MSEIIKDSSGKNESKERKSDWEVLAEGQIEADWDSVAETEFQGEVSEVKDAELNINNKVERLRDWIDLDAIARKEDPDGLATAESEGEVRRVRKDEREAELKQNEQRQTEVDQRLEEMPKELADANTALIEFGRRERQGVLIGLKKALGIGKGEKAELEKKLTTLEMEQAGLQRERRRLEDEQKSLEAVVAEVDVDGPKREFLEKFETPLTPEEKQEGLDFGALAELSTDEYLQLWRRLNPFFVTHVTRQGVRDHNAMIYHSDGLGEFQDGMTGILADKKVLRPPAEVRWGLGREVTEENVEGALEKMLFEKKVNIAEMRARGLEDREIVEELVAGLPVNTTIATAEPWTDRQAVHFGQLLVSDDYYGGERGNEAFFVFPTDVIASQCRFGGHIRDGLTTAQVGSETKWNDMFVWPQEQDITIDAGLTFLPKSTMVDTKTGSKYQTKTVMVDGRVVRTPEVDEEGVTKLVEWMKGLKPEDTSVKMATELESRYDMSKLREEGLAAGVPERILHEVLDASNGFQYELQRFVNGGELKSLWLSAEELEKMSVEERRERSVREFLDGNAATWKLAENTMPAEEYWKKYFAEHPEQQPAHVIYYDGDPSETVVSTLKTAGILEETQRPYNLANYDEWQRYTGKGDSHERDGNWLGFEGNLVRDEASDEALQRPHRQFNEIAGKKIAEHYGLAI